MEKTTKTKEAPAKKVEEQQPSRERGSTEPTKANVGLRNTERSNANVKKPAKDVRYIESVGRRKTAIARVRYYATEQKLLDNSGIRVNGKEYKVYFPVASYRSSLVAPLKTLKVEDGFIDIKIVGGGMMAQAEAASLGISRVLVKSSEGYRKILRAGGHLTRDARAVERKKPGKTKARRGHQWRKR